MKTTKGYCQCGCGQKTNICTMTNKKRGIVCGEPMPFVIGHHKKLTGKNHPQWKGGRSESDPRGYVEIYTPNHPRAHRVYVREHILLAENALGKLLPLKSHVHHCTPEQLVICQDLAYHKLLHRRQVAYEACGHANWLKCRYCLKWDEPVNMYVNPNRPGQAFHKKCRNEFMVKQRLAKKGLTSEQHHWRRCWICKIYDDPNNLIIPKTGGAHHHSCRVAKDKYYRLRKHNGGNQNEQKA